MMKDIMKKSIAAGSMISIGVTVKLCCSNQIIGALLFSIGLFFICYLDMSLFTGKIGYINKKNWTEYPLIWIGNFVGCAISMILIRLSKPEITDTVNNVLNAKIHMDIIPLSILSLFCGVLMYLAVNNYKTSNSDNSKLFGIIIAVVVFLLSGFEHSIANMAYSVLYISNMNDFIECLRVIMISTVFNAIGSVTIRKLLKTR